MEFNVQETAGNGRIVIIPRPLTLPGSCAICGYAGTNAGDEGDVRVFIDFNLDIDYFGRVYWCSSCLLEAANLLGWLGVEQAEKMRETIATQESELIVLREQNERLRSSLASLLGKSDDDILHVRSDSSEDEQQGELEFTGAESPSDSSVSEPESAGVSGATDDTNPTLGQFQL